MTSYEMDKSQPSESTPLLMSSGKVTPFRHSPELTSSENADALSSQTSSLYNSKSFHRKGITTFLMSNMYVLNNVFPSYFIDYALLIDSGLHPF